MSDMTQYNSVSERISKKERVTHPALRLVISTAVILGLWQLIVVAFTMPSFILPAPVDVLNRLISRYDVLLAHTWVTAQEILLGLGLGLSMGLLFALQMLLFEPLKRWLLPILIASQAIPVFAIAPVLMLWLGYGIASKVVMAAIIIFFPVTTCCYDGLRNTPTGYLDLAKNDGRFKMATAASHSVARGTANIGFRHSCRSRYRPNWSGRRRVGRFK